MEFYDIDAHYLNVKNTITGEGNPDIGTVGDPFGTVYGATVNATNVNATNIDGQDYNVTGDITGTGAPNIGTGGSPFGTFYGQATSAQWGDLAEKYRTKELYESGTVVCVSPDDECDVEQTSEDLCSSAVGVISAQPGYTMNNELEEGQYVALVGLVPVKILGTIKKGDFIVPTISGCARAGKPEEIAYKLGVCNETSDRTDVRLVKCIIK